MDNLDNLRDGRKKDWFYLDNELVDREDLDIYEKAAYVVLARYADNNKDTAFPAYKTIAKKIGCSKRKVIEAIKALEEKKILIKKIRYKKNSGENDSNLYKLLSVKISNLDILGDAGGAPPSAQHALPSAGDALPPSAQDAPRGAQGAPKQYSYKNTYSFKNTYLKHNTEISLQIKNLCLRYSDKQLEVIENYFDILRWTRKHGRIADSVVKNICKKWLDYKIEAVMYALKVYIDNPKHHDKRENYCYGIMRNATAEQIEGYFKSRSKINNNLNIKTPIKTKFHNFEQRTNKYTEDDLENMARKKFV